MFTGLITAVGVVEAVTAQDGGRDLVIRAPWDDVVLGELVLAHVVQPDRDDDLPR